MGIVEGGLSNLAPAIFQRLVYLSTNDSKTLLIPNYRRHQFEMTCAADQESIHLWRPLRLSTSTPAQRDGWSQSHWETCLYPSLVFHALHRVVLLQVFWPSKKEKSDWEKRSGFHFRNPWTLMDRLLSSCGRQITRQDVINAYPRCQMDHKMTKCTP